MKRITHFAAAMILILAASACNWEGLTSLPPGPDDPVNTPVDTTVVDTTGPDTTGQVQGCPCDPDSLHLVTEPAFIQGWVQWDFTPDSVIWKLGGRTQTTADDVYGTDLQAMLEEKWPNLEWTVYDTTNATVIFCDGTNDKQFLYNDVTSTPYIMGLPGNKYWVGWNIQSMYVGGALSFDNFKTELMKRKSTKGMNLRGSDFTLEQSMTLWELLLQYCECRVADPGAFPAYRADFRWGLYDPEIVDRFMERLWMSPTSIQGPSPELIRA